MPESIIVYRNPLEKMLWESGLATPYLSGLAVAIVAGFAMLLLTDLYNDRWARRQKQILATEVRENF